MSIENAFSVDDEQAEVVVRLRLFLDEEDMDQRLFAVAKTRVDSRQHYQMSSIQAFDCRQLHLRCFFVFLGS